MILQSTFSIGRPAFYEYSCGLDFHSRIALPFLGRCHPLTVNEGHVTDCSNNTFRALRVVNATHDWLYAEFMDDMTEWDFETIQYHELQDLKDDPDQKGNTYGAASAATKAELAARLDAAYHCAGGESCAVAH